MSQTKAQLLDGKSATIQYSAGSASAPAISFTGDTNTGIYSPGADQVAISTNGTGRLFVGSSGDVNIDSGTFYVDATNNRVGVNTTSPISPLEVIGSYISTRQSVTGDQGLLILKGNSGGAAGATIESSFSAGGYGPLTFTTSASERLRITSAGLVGVGTSSPWSLSTVRSLGTTGDVTSARQVSIGDSSTYSVSLGYYQTGAAAPYAGAIQALDNNAGTRLLLNPLGGNVGIGTTSPAGLLHCNIGTSFAPGAFWDSSTAVFGGSGNAGSAFAIAHDTTNGTRLMSIEPGVAWRALQLISSSVIFKPDGANEKARFDTSGRLLVGTSSALTNYQWFGTTYIAPSLQIANEGVAQASLGLFCNNAVDTNASQLMLAKAASGTAGLVNSGETLGIIAFNGGDGTNLIRAAEIMSAVDGTPGANDMPGRIVLSTTPAGASSPAERMRISNNGYVGINGTASRRLEVYETRAGEFTAALNNESTTGHALALVCKSSDTTGKYLDGYSSSANTTRVAIYSNGNIQNANNSYGALSDARLKENIVDANSQWDDIKAVQVRNYNLKTDPDHRQIGVVAQEIEQVSPGLVYESPDHDAQGNDLGTVTKSVNYSVLYMKAVKALQEAMERIEILEQRLTDAGIA